jgi:hypothetical protein
MEPRSGCPTSGPSTQASRIVGAVGAGRLSAWLLAAIGAAAVASVAVQSTEAATAFDGHWAKLQNCLSYGESHPLNQVESTDGSVRTTSPGHLRIYAPDGFVAAITYAGTYARAEAQAKRIKPERGSPAFDSTGGGLAIGDVTYYFTARASTPQLTVITSCLVRTYADQPRWPRNLDPTSLPGSGKSPAGS